MRFGVKMKFTRNLGRRIHDKKSAALVQGMVYELDQTLALYLAMALE
jgi:hypothetical protein